jgi:DnaJ-class molecular chaperone
VDAEKRKIYDKYGEEGLKNDGGGGGSPFGDFHFNFDDFFKGFDEFEHDKTHQQHHKNFAGFNFEDIFGDDINSDDGFGSFDSFFGNPNDGSSQGQKSGFDIFDDDLFGFNSQQEVRTESRTNGKY